MSVKNFHFLSRFLILCLGLFIFASCSSSKTIVNGLDEREANEILVFLEGKGIPAVKVAQVETGAGKTVVWNIEVDELRATEAMALLNQSGLPRRRGQSLLNIFASGGLVPSELQEKIRYRSGLGEQIASIIRKIDGVLDADVQISFPDENPLNPAEKKGDITASVYVKHSGVLDDPNAHLIPKIKRLVAASVPGLDYDNVTVVGDLARYSSTPYSGPVVSSQDQQLTRVWSIVIAKESLSRFRIIFFSFIVVLLLLLLSLVWLLWKLLPIIQSNGGLRELFRLKPLEKKETDKVQASPEELPAPEDTSGSAEDQGQIDADFEDKE